MCEQLLLDMLSAVPTADGEGIYLLAPCYVMRQERVTQCMGSLTVSMQRFPRAVLEAQLLVLFWYEGFEGDMAAANLHPFEDAAAFLPSGHLFSIPGLRVRLEAERVVVRCENLCSRSPLPLRDCRANPRATASSVVAFQTTSKVLL